MVDVGLGTSSVENNMHINTGSQHANLTKKNTHLAYLDLLWCQLPSLVQTHM